MTKTTKTTKISRKDTLEKFALKLVDTMDKIPDVALQTGVAYTGIKATNHWTGGLLGLVGLKLAQSGNLFAGASGVALLTWLGLTGWVDPYEPDKPAEGFVSGMSGVGAGGGGYIPPVEPAGILMETSECLSQGGTIVSVIPMTTQCICKLPEISEPDPPRPGPPGGIFR